MGDKPGRRALSVTRSLYNEIRDARPSFRTCGGGGIRTPDRAFQPYNGLANRRLQPLGHSSVKADMPDAGASRKRQIRRRRILEPFCDSR